MTCLFCLNVMKNLYIQTDVDPSAAVDTGLAEGEGVRLLCKIFGKTQVLTELCYTNYTQ